MGYSRDPKTQHDADPTACNDTDAEYIVQLVKIASDGTQSDAAAATAQLRAILGSTVAPSSYFAMSVLDNSLIAQIDSITTAHDQWQIVVDDDTEPTIGDGSWTPGTLGGPYTLPDWDLHTYRAWINDGTTVSAVPTADGSASVELSAGDTIKPTGSITLAQKAGYETSTWTLTSTWDDSGSGVNESRLVIREKGGAVLFGEGEVSANLELTGAPGQSLQVELVIIDFQGNTRIVESAVVALAENTAVGTASFATTQPTDGTAAFSVVEDAGPLTTDLKLTGNTSGGAPSYNVKLRLHTIDPDQMDVDSSTWTTVNGTITHSPTGDGSPDTQTLTIPVSALTPADAKIRRGELYIDQSSLSAGLSAGSNNAILFDMPGSGGGVTAYPNSGTPYYEVKIDATDYQSLSGGEFNTPPTTGTFDGQTCLEQPNNAHSYNTTPAYPLSDTPAAFYDVSLPAGTFDIRLYGGATASNANSYRFSINGVDGLLPLANSLSVTTAGTLDWYLHGSTFTLTAAAVVRIGVHQREVKMPPYARLYIAMTDSGYTLPAGLITPDTPVSTGAPTADARNPLVPIGDIDSLDNATVVLTPNNGDDGIAATSRPQAVVTGATQLLFNYGSPAVTQNGLSIDTEWTTDKIDTISCSTQGWANNATIDIDLTDVGRALVAGVWKKIPDQTSWTYNIEDTSGGSYQPFANVPIPAGRMTAAWFELVKAQYSSTTADDPVDWPALYAARQEYIAVQTEADLQSALDNASAGTVIGIESATLNQWSVIARNAGSLTQPIVIAPASKLTGTVTVGQPVTADGNAGNFMEFDNGANNYIVGGIRVQNYGLSAYRLLDGAFDTTNTYPGATNVRITDSFFYRIGVVAGATRGFVTVGFRCHNFRYDHNASYECFNDLRWEKGQDINKLDVTTGSRVDHSYFGPAAPAGTYGTTYYEVNAMRMSNGSHAESAPDMDVLVEHCVIDFPAQGESDGEVIEIKANGTTVRNCIAYGTGTNPYFSMRQGHRHTFQNNYLRGMGMTLFGADCTITGNVIDGQGIKRGIQTTRWGQRNNNTKLPETRDGVISYNTVLNTLIACIDVGSIDGAGASEPLTNIDTTRNYCRSATGSLIDFYDDPADGAPHVGCDFSYDYYDDSLGASKGTAYDNETSPADDPASTVGYGSQTLDEV